MLVISLYPRHLRLQSNKENFMSRMFFHWDEAHRNKRITNAFLCSIRFESHSRIMDSRIWMQWSCGNFRKEKRSIYSGVFHPHSTFNYCQLKFKNYCFLSTLRFFLIRKILLKKACAVARTSCVLTFKIGHTISLLITVIFLMFKVKIEKNVKYGL